MKILNNPRKQTYFIQQKNDNINTYITVPVAGAHRASRLTIRAGDVRLDLNGRQIRALRSVLDKSRELNTPMSRRTTKRSRTTK